MINLEDLDVLKNKIIYNTTSDEYVVYEKKETTNISADYKLLGFLNGYSYSYSDGYLVKSTIDQIEIARIAIDAYNGVFIEGFEYMYFYGGNKIYKVSESMCIDWVLSFNDEVQDVTMDYYGSIYVLFKNIRSITKYSKNSEHIYYINESDDPTAKTRLYKTFVNKGGGHLYVIGSRFYDNKVTSFIDHYNTRKCKKIDSNILLEYDNVVEDDPYFEYKDLYVDGDFLYIYANNYIEKLNIKLRSIWKYGFGYNYISDEIDSLNEIIFDNNKFHNRIYFCENFKTTGGYSFGKLNTNGSLQWKIINPENVSRSNISICIYNSDIFLVTQKDVAAKANYVLSLDNNRVLFETRDGNLVRIVENNYDSIFNPENYIGEYLLGNEIKEGIPKKVYYPLMYDEGNIIDEDEDYILIEEDNPDYNNPDNYNYFKLIGDMPASLREYTRVLTKDGKYILSFNNSYIESLYPYQPELSTQYIIDENGNILNDDKSNTRYVDYFYILADRYKFFQSIVTKKKELSIVTKDKGFDIIRKSKYVYKYVIKQLLDVDIIVEHLAQNGILDTTVPKYVERLRHHTTHMIEDMQKALKPQYFNIEPCKRYGYQYDGYDYPLRMPKTQMFMCKNIPFIGKRKDNSIFIESMSTLVENEEITPFLLFLNGKAIKWSDMTIIRDWYFSFIIISNNSDESENLEAIMFPCVIRYGEDNGVLPDCTTGLYFDNDGLLTDDISKISLRIEVLDKDVTGNTQIITQDKPYIEFSDIQYNQLSNENNILVFENNEFFGDSRFYLDSCGENIYKYARPVDNVVFKTFYFDKANVSKNMIFDVPVQSEVKNNIIEKIEDNELKPTDNFMVPFDFYLTRDKSYLRNISEATRYILTYHMQLLIDFYKDQSNIKSVIFTGEKVLELSSKTEGFLVMPRQRTGIFHDYIMVFKNDKLYDHHDSIIYDNNMLKIPILNYVESEDRIEILHFKKADNNYYNLTITDNEPDYIPDNLRYDDFLLFGNSYSGNPIYPDFNSENSGQYELRFKYKNSFNDYGKYKNTEIVLEDPYYKNKSINITSKRQFHYMRYNVVNTDISVNITMSPEFRFCHNKNQYMIFFNGDRINQNEWNLSVPNDSNTIENIIICADLPVHPGDRIDIFYIPYTYSEIILENHTSRFGDIILDTNELDYPFDRELFLIFIDGKRVQPDRIQNISANRVRILSVQPTYHNITICKYLEPTTVLQKVFSYSDKWTDSINSLSEVEYEKLFTKIKDIIKI